MKRMLLLSAMILTSVGLHAQFRVTSTSIANGQVNVAQQDTLWLTFSSAVNADTLLGGMRQAPFLRFYFQPGDSQTVKGAVISADTTRIGFPLTLKPGLVYSFGLQMAVSKTGAMLETPVYLRFTTSGSISQGSIAGKVTLADGSPAPSHTVLFYPDYATTMRSMDDPWTNVVGVATTDSEGNYELKSIPDGNYFLRAVRVNGMQPPFGSKDFHVGFFDANSDRFPDRIQLNRTAGRNQTGKNITVYTPEFSPSTTAASRDSAMKAVEKINPGFKLVSVIAAGSLDSLGNSAGWIYQFRNERDRTDALTYYSGNQLLAGLVFQSNGQFLAPVDPSWVNSDVISTTLKPVIKGLNSVEPPLVLASLAVINSSVEANVKESAWVVSASFKEADGRPKTNVYTLNAATGQINVPARLTARAAADSVQKTINMMALPVAPRLAAVTGFADSQGTAALWTFLYLAPESKTSWFASVDGKGKVFISSRRDSSAFQVPLIRGNWLDSKVILDSSEVWKMYKDQTPNPQVFMNLKSIQIPFPADTVTLWSLSMSPPQDGMPRPQVQTEDNLVASTGQPYAASRYTAFEGSEGAIAAAKTWKNDAALVRVGNSGQYTVDGNGTTAMWQYVFISNTQKDSLVSMWVAGNSRKLDIYPRFRNARDTVPVPVLPELSNLINSDRAVQLAETEKGADFRSNNPDRNVVASLDQVRVKRDSTLSLWSVAYPFQTAESVGHHRVLINAATGEVVRENTRTTDRTPFETAQKTASEWARDAQFRYAKADSVNAEGLVAVWVFGFWSQSKLQALFVEVTGGTTVTNQWTTTDVPRRFAKGAAIRNWVESARAIARADSALGNVLARQNYIRNILLELTNGTAGQGKVTAGTMAAQGGDYWAVGFVQDNGVVEYVNVGENGEVTVSNEETTGGLPRSLSLEQNFPNPFNPSTTIQYALPAAAKVTLTVYNLLGQQVAVLVNGQQPAGNYQISFNAKNLSSGVYFYRLSAGSQNLVRRMTLVK